MVKKTKKPFRRQDRLVPCARRTFIIRRNPGSTNLGRMAAF
ncbi:MAG: hypothetical protein WA917_00645 [Comamonas sp.]